jgi:hypothetical protein
MMFQEFSSLFELQAVRRSDAEERHSPVRQSRYAIRLDSLFLRIIRVPSNLDSLGALGSRSITVRLRARQYAL